MKCVHPEGHDYQDIRDVLTSTPGSKLYEMRVMFDAVDANVAMPIVEVVEEAGGIAVTWRVTFKRAFKVNGDAVEQGATYDLDANLRKSGDQWLIYGL
jgi:hypothetical protein